MIIIKTIFESLQVSYFDAEEAAEVITSGDYDEANHEAEMQEEDGSHKPCEESFLCMSHINGRKNKYIFLDILVS